MQSTVIINNLPYNLEEILADCWHRLVNGEKSAKHPFHCPTLGTLHNNEVELRTVVLRKAIPSDRTLIFYTDNRSPKINQIKENNKISWLFYDEKSRIQIRIKAKATIHHLDDIALSAWKNSRLESRKCYLVIPAPSTFIDLPDDGLPKNLDVENLTEEIIANGYQNFAVVKTEITIIDWLILNHTGHRRAQFIYEGNEIKKEWMLP